MIERNDTIVAPATPPGEGGVAVIRVSGPAAVELLARHFRASGSFARDFTPRSHHLYHGHFIDGQGSVIDEVMAVVMRGPRSYTREDVVEIHCHGGRVLVEGILDALVSSGARLAGPGEFTLRAFLNGRLDLARAEAVIDLIRSRSETAGRQALAQLDGRLSRAIHSLRDRLVGQLVMLEAWIDFPEEDLDLSALAHLRGEIQAVDREVCSLVRGFEEGRVLREGLSVLILGRPNVGKSSLLNALLGESRAIVTDIPGTTRDLIEEQLVLEGVPLRLVDTAGVRQTEDVVEAEGVRRARSKVAAADLVLLVIDGSLPPGDDDRLALEVAGDCPLLLVINKSDLPQAVLPAPWRDLPLLRVSTHTAEGLDILGKQILEAALSRGAGEREDVLVTSRRHREALVRCGEALQRLLEELRPGAPAEILALELRGALDALGDITGETTPDDILEQIFSRFCIGK